MLLLRLMQILHRNLDHIRAPRAQIQPLVADTASAVNLDRIHKRPPLPRIVHRRQRQQPIALRHKSKRARANRIAGRILPRNRIYAARKLSRQHRIRRRHREDHRIPKRSNRRPRTLRTGTLQRLHHALRRQRRAIMKAHARPQPELPAMVPVLRLPSHRKRRQHRARTIDTRQRIEDQPPPNAVRAPATDRPASPRAACRHSADACARDAHTLGKQQTGNQTTGCKPPTHGMPHIEPVAAS